MARALHQRDDRFATHRELASDRTVGVDQDGTRRAVGLISIGDGAIGLHEHARRREAREQVAIFGARTLADDDEREVFGQTFVPVEQRRHERATRSAGRVQEHQRDRQPGGTQRRKARRFAHQIRQLERRRLRCDRQSRRHGRRAPERFFPGESPAKFVEAQQYAALLAQYLQHQEDDRRQRQGDRDRRERGPVVVQQAEGGGVRAGGRDDERRRRECREEQVAHDGGGPDRRARELAEAAALRPAPARQIHDDCERERAEQRTRTKCRPERARAEQESDRNQQF